MVSKVLASVLNTYLGQYLEISDTQICVGSQVSLTDVRLKDTALSELGLPVRCLYGKVSKLVVKIPWFNLFSGTTFVEVHGLHILVVPESNVSYNEVKEAGEAHALKLARLARMEDYKVFLKQRKEVKNETTSAEETKENDTGDDNSRKNNSSFVERFTANIIRNTVINISNVHVRYENQLALHVESSPASSFSRFAVGLTVDSIQMDSKDGQTESERLSLFEKSLTIQHISLYWSSNSEMYGNDTSSPVDLYEIFSSSIARSSSKTSRDALDGSLTRSLPCLVGPITLRASFKYCPDPETYDYIHPKVKVGINVEELRLRLTKTQYHNLLSVVTSFEYMTRAAPFRKYKARNELENLTSYRGKSKQLWKFAFDVIYNEHVIRRKNNWSWEHMHQHIQNCRRYQSLYAKLLRSKQLKSKLDDVIQKEIDDLEWKIDELNISIQRQLALKNIDLLEGPLPVSGGIWSWLGWGSSPSQVNNQPNSATKIVAEMDKIMSESEKNQLFGVLDDFSESPRSKLSFHPRRYVENIITFGLDVLLFVVTDDTSDSSSRTIMKCRLQSVDCFLFQRPSATYTCFELNLASLDVDGLDDKCRLVTTMLDDGGGDDMLDNRGSSVSSTLQKLFFVSFEMNPPRLTERKDVDFDNRPSALMNNYDLDEDKGSIYDQRVRIQATPLKIDFHGPTLRAFFNFFKSPDSMSSTDFYGIQQGAIAKMKNYTQSTTLGMQYVIENHSLVDLQLRLMSSILVVTHQDRNVITGGEEIFDEVKSGAKDRRASTVIISVGDFQIKSSALDESIVRQIKNGTFAQCNDNGKSLSTLHDDSNQTMFEHLREHVYDRFDVTLQNTNLIVSLSKEDWWSCINGEFNENDPPPVPQIPSNEMFVLKPMFIKLSVFLCLIDNDVNLPLVKTHASMDSLSIELSDGRLMSFVSVMRSVLKFTEFPDDGGGVDTEANEKKSPQVINQFSTIKEESESFGSQESMMSAVSSMGELSDRTAVNPIKSLVTLESETVSFMDDVLTKRDEARTELSAFMTKFLAELYIGSISLQMNCSLLDELFSVKFELSNIEVTSAVREFDFSGNLTLGKFLCRYDSDESCVDIVYTTSSKPLVSLSYIHTENVSPRYEKCIAENELILKTADINVCVNRDLLSKCIEGSQRIFDNLLEEMTSSIVNSSFVNRNSVTRGSGTSSNFRSNLGSSTKFGSTFLHKKNVQTKKESCVDVICKFVANVDIDKVNVEFQFSKDMNFSKLVVSKVSLHYAVFQDRFVIRSKLIEFKLFDTYVHKKHDISFPSVFPLIVENLDDSVLDCSITIRDWSTQPNNECVNVDDLCDIYIKSSMGRIRFVMTMRFINDFLTFIDPLISSDMKKSVTEGAAVALEEATRELKQAYERKTKVSLQISIKAPTVIFPIKSNNFDSLIVANLGEIVLRNEFKSNHNVSCGEKPSLHLMDCWSFDLFDTSLMRGDLVLQNNEELTIETESEILSSLSLTISMRRPIYSCNHGHSNEDLDLSFQGGLGKIRINLTHKDYETILNVVSVNLTEKGYFSVSVHDVSDTLDDSPRKTPHDQIANKNDAPSRGKIAPKEVEVEAKNLLRFEIKFDGLEVALYQDLYSAHLNPLVLFHIVSLKVGGFVTEEITTKIQITVANCIVQDIRKCIRDTISRMWIRPDDGSSAPRLMEAKVSEDRFKDCMILLDIELPSAKYSQKIDINISSFRLVASISYLLEIANFFTQTEIYNDPNSEVQYLFDTNTQGIIHEGIMYVTPTSFCVNLLMEHPNIYVIDNFDVENELTDALILNSSVTLSYIYQECLSSDVQDTSQALSNRSLGFSSLMINCLRTQIFAAAVKRDFSVSSSNFSDILEPCEIQISYSIQEMNRTRINVDVPTLVLTLSPQAAKIVTTCLQTFLNDFIYGCSLSEPIGVKCDDDNLATDKSYMTCDNNFDASEFKPKRYSSDTFWFLKGDRSCEALELLKDQKGADASNSECGSVVDSLTSDADVNSLQRLSEMAIIDLSNVVVKIEVPLSNTGSSNSLSLDFFPLILLESAVTATVVNWSMTEGRPMSFKSDIIIEMAYFNQNLGLWEPVIESTVIRQNNSDEIVRKKWPLSLNYEKYPPVDVDKSADSVDGFLCVKHLPPNQSLTIESRSMLDITITRKFIDSFNIITNWFQVAFDSSSGNYSSSQHDSLSTEFSLGEGASSISSRNAVSAHLVVSNVSGIDWQLNIDPRLGLTRKGHRTDVTKKSGSLNSSYFAIKNTEVITFELDNSVCKSPNIGLKCDPMYTSPLKSQISSIDYSLYVRLNSKLPNHSIPLTKLGCRFFSIASDTNLYKNAYQTPQGFISELSMSSAGLKQLCLRSLVTIENKFDVDVQVFAYDPVKNQYVMICSLASKEVHCVEYKFVYSEPGHFYFKAKGSGNKISTEPYLWHKLCKQLSHSQTIACPNSNGSGSTSFFLVHGSRTKVRNGNTNRLDCYSFNILINPVAVIRNFLPATLYLSKCEDSSLPYQECNEAQYFTSLKSGESLQLSNCDLGQSQYVFKIFNFRNHDWMGSAVPRLADQDFFTWQLDSLDMAGGLNRPSSLSKMKFFLSVNSCVSKDKTLVLSVYSPIWMVNKTGLDLYYKGDDASLEIHHPSLDQSTPHMFSYVPRSIFGKRKAFIRVRNSQWSQSFPIDTIEDAGKVSCKHQMSLPTPPSKSMSSNQLNSAATFSTSGVESLRRDKDGYVTCNTFHIGVTISMSKSSWTKIISFTPYYMMINRFPNQTIYIREISQLPSTQTIANICDLQTAPLISSGDSCDENNAYTRNDGWIAVKPNRCIAFWPRHSGDHSNILLVAAVDLSEEERDVNYKAESRPFSVDQESRSTLLLFGNPEIKACVNVDIKITESQALLQFFPYSFGMAPVRIINHTTSCVMRYSDDPNFTLLDHTLNPEHTVLWTWERSVKQNRAFSWRIQNYASGISKQIFKTALEKDEQGVIKLEDGFISWISFLDGPQRVLLVTDDNEMCFKIAHSSGENEKIENEIQLSLFGIGISLVNNRDDASVHEILYTTMTSSSVVWDLKRRGKTRFKQLPPSLCRTLENDYQNYHRHKSVSVNSSSISNIQATVNKHRKIRDGNVDVQINFEEMRMYKPYEGRLKRQYQKGFWLQIRTSKHQNQLHFIVNRVQVDNQIPHCHFPVIMCPVPPPDSVLADSIPKPLIEMAILQCESPEHTNTKQFKYVHALIQEFRIKIDRGLIDSIHEMFYTSNIVDSSSTEMNNFIEEDFDSISKSLMDLHISSSELEDKHFFDDLHLSPLKVHLSFSLSSYKSSLYKVKQKSEEGLPSEPSISESNILALFLKSIGVTITDAEDVVFRLAYFDRKHRFYTFSELGSEMVSHYTSQGVKQAYVYVFGLDVFGNPLGLVMDVSRSVEDLFYEPFQGAVEGPSEFAEGLTIGVKSVFSGVVGGTAGTFSRITGALGKGLATLTFDESFQKKRSEAIKKRGSQSFGKSIARNSKGLVMGFFDGVTGVATKPIEGAIDEGVGGFFKGVGKGVVGLVTRPTGGIVDFASGTLDSVKRVTQSIEDVTRVRDTRFFGLDGVVRNFDAKEAYGYRLFREVDKGRCLETDLYICHELISSTPDTKGSKNALLLTDRRILLIANSSITGNFTGEWQFLLVDLEGPVPVGQDNPNELAYILLRDKNDGGHSMTPVSSFFSGLGGSKSSLTKKIYVGSREKTRSFAREIEKIRMNAINSL